VDNKGKKVDLTMAYVGTRKLFEVAGFVKAADTDSVSGGFPRVLMRLDLRWAAASPHNDPIGKSAITGQRVRSTLASSQTGSVDS
jgi:hypothetical protein